MNDDIEQRIIERLKLSYPPPYFKNWAVRNGYGTAQMAEVFINGTAGGQPAAVRAVVAFGSTHETLLAAVETLPASYRPPEWLVEAEEQQSIGVAKQLAADLKAARDECDAAHKLFLTLDAFCFCPDTSSREVAKYREALAAYEKIRGDNAG